MNCGLGRGEVCDSAGHSFGSSVFWDGRGWRMHGMPLQTRWHWLKLGQGNQQGMQHKCDLINVFGILHAASLYFDGFGCDFFFVKFWWEWKSRLFWILRGLPCRHMNDQRAWPNIWNHSSKRALCPFWLWSFILYALNSLHPDWGQLQPVFWFMPSNLNPFKLPLPANSQCVVISKSHYLPSA